MALKKKCDGFFSFFFRVLENTNEINALSLWLFCVGIVRVHCVDGGGSPVMRDENRFILIHISLFDDFVLYRVGMALWRRFFSE